MAALLIDNQLITKRGMQMRKFDFQNAPPVKRVETKIPEWDPEAKFFLDELRADVCMQLVEHVTKLQEEKTLDSKGVEMYAEMLSRCLSNEAGERPSKEWLMGTSFTTLQRLGQEALRLNGFDPESQVTAEKN